MEEGFRYEVCLKNVSKNERKGKRDTAENVEVLFGRDQDG